MYMSKFTPSELEVMQVLWEHGSLKPAEIEERFPRPIKNAALRSLLLVLLEKGHVTRQQKGKAFYYKAKTPRENTFKKMARQMANVFCGGSPAALIAQLIKAEELSADDIRELQEIANRKIKDKPNRGENIP